MILSCNFDTPGTIELAKVSLAPQIPSGAVEIAAVKVMKTSCSTRKI
jgi:hypothetical protein